MKKTEYTIIDVKAPTKNGIITLLNKFAETGWELVCFDTLNYSDYEWQMRDCVFKRTVNEITETN